MRFERVNACQKSHNQPVASLGFRHVSAQLQSLCVKLPWAGGCHGGVSGNLCRLLVASGLLRHLYILWAHLNFRTPFTLLSFLNRP